MFLWLDDVRNPVEYGYLGATWAKTYDEAIAALSTGEVEAASLDHDLTVEATLGNPLAGEKTGYDVVLWMEKTGVWPPGGVHVHSMNPSGAARMRQVIAIHYGGEAWRTGRTTSAKPAGQR